MTKTAIRTIPTQLPHASLYLDDLFEIEDILLKEYAKLPKPIDISFEYEIDGKIKLTTHQELEEHAGHSHYFTMRSCSSGSFGHDLLRFYGLLKPTFESSYTLGDQQWSVFAKVEQIFSDRRDKFKNFIIMITTQIIMIFLIPSLLGFFSGWLMIKTHFKPISYVPLVVSILMTLIFGYGGLKRNKIYFKRVREYQQAKVKARNERFDKFFWLLGGAILGIIASFVAAQ
ncbi:MAG: hypothetical protein WAN35_21605, partial [Terracidiphilus sp.]